MKSFLLFFISFYFLIGNAEILSHDFQNIPLFIRNATDNVDQPMNEETFRVRNTWYNRLKNGNYKNVKISIPSAKGTEILQLSQRKITPDEGIKVSTSSGNAYLSDPGLFYFGEIKNKTKSTAILSIRKEKLYLFWQDEGGNQMTISNHPENEVAYLLSPDNNNRKSDFKCGSTDSGNPKLNKDADPKKSLSVCGPTDPLDCAGSVTTLHVHYELDHLTYVDENSSIDDCIVFIARTHAVVNHIYSNIQNVDNNQDTLCPFTQVNSGGVNLLMSGLHIWDSPDPFPMDLDLRLAAFQTERPTFNGDIAHLINKVILMIVV